MLAGVRVVVITDRRLCDDIPGRVAQILAACPRGSVLVQIREKDLDGGSLLQLVREVLAVTRPAGAPLFVNDRLDVALAAGADGVHLPERGLTIAEARPIDKRSVLVGCSRHTVDAVVSAAAEGADLIQLGPIWTTPGKGAPLGVGPLSVRRQLPATARLVAVGGIDGPARAREAAVAGADAVAVIRAAWQADDAGALVASMVAAAGG